MRSITDSAALDPDDTDVDAMDDDELAGLPDARIEEAFARTHARIERLEVRRLRLLAEFDRRRAFERDGYLSTTAWLAGAFRFAHTRARKLLSLTRGLRQMPHTREALERSEISGSALDLLVRAREVAPPAFDEAEPQLVEAAKVHSIGDLSRVLTPWRRLVDAARGGDLHERLRARRYLHTSVLLDGMVCVDGELDPECGERLLTALGAILDAEAHSREASDARSPRSAGPMPSKRSAAGSWLAPTAPRWAGSAHISRSPWGWTSSGRAREPRSSISRAR